MTVLTDPARLAALRETMVLDTAPEEAFDRITRLAARLLRSPLAQVNLIDDQRQFSKSSFAPAGWPEGRDTPLADSFCRHTVTSAELLVVEDARTHPLVSSSAVVNELGVVSYAGVPMTNADGHTLGALCVVGFEPRHWEAEEIQTLRDLAATVSTELELRREVTRRRQSEEALREQASLLDLAHDSILVRDLDGTIRFWNGGAERVYGWSRLEAVGKISHDLLRTGFSAPRDEIEREVLESGLWEGELRHRTRDGSEIVVESRWALQRGAGGDARAVMEINRDVTERRQAEDRVHAKRALLELLHVSAAAANSAATLEEAVERVIRHVCSHTVFAVGHAYVVGREDGADLVPTRLWCREHSDRLERFRGETESRRFDRGIDAPGQVLATGEPIWIPDLVSHSGFQRMASAREAGLRTAVEVPVRVGEEVVAVLEFFSELSLPLDGILLDALNDVGTQLGRVVERTRTGDFQRVARETAERANRAKSEFLSRMSHELRTPMNAILGFAQLLEMEGLDDAQGESVEQIMKGGRHLLALINEVLDISRIEAGRLSLSPEPVELKEVLDEVLKLVWPLAQQRRVTLPERLPRRFERHVRADRQRLKQVLLNLLSNAIKYNREHGTVEVSCTRVRGEFLRVSVTDTGPGIASAKRALLFQPFERLGAEQEGGADGTGLGLALSKALVEAMMGEIGVDTEPGKGSTFWVELPVAQATTGRYEPESIPPARAEPDQSQPRYTVLYIEDNLSNLKLVQRVLSHGRPVELIPAVQGTLGLDLAFEHRPDLILLDLNLPDLRGEEVLLRLRADERTAEIPVVVLSADATPGQVQRLLMSGARAYLTKPIDVKQFLDLVEEVADGNGVHP